MHSTRRLFPRPLANNRSIRAWALLALVVCAGSAAALAAPPAGGEARGAKAAANAAPVAGGDALPITRVTLYRSGVGSFQRAGTVDGAARVQLKFDVTQLNDILKSLQLADLDNGRIDSVSFPSKDPLSRRLDAFGVPIADAPGLPALVGRLRGSAVTLTTGEGAVSGTILAVENRRTAQGKDQAPIDTPYVSLVTSEGIKAVDIYAVRSFRLQDQALNDELNKALAAVADARADKTRVLDLSLSGEGTRRVVVRYIHETPIWKTSYRLILPEQTGDAGAAPASKDAKDATSGDDKVNIQGWAIVENTSDSDWRDVRLGLVAGRPVGFTMDLSEPLYLHRPALAVPTVPGATPKEYVAGMIEKANGADEIKLNAMSAGKARGRQGSPAFAPMPASPSMAQARAGGAVLKDAEESALQEDAALSAGGSGVDYSTQVVEAGEVFSYEVPSVTIERQRSAMIPFLAAPLPARRVSIYNAADRADRCMRGLDFTNTSSLQLLPGPIAVYDGAAYAGDSTIAHVSPGERRLLAYAVDLDVTARTDPQNTEEITKIRIVKGTLQVTSLSRLTTDYTFSNADKKRPRTVIVEHRKTLGYTLKSPATFMDETPALHRFEVPVAAGSKATLQVVSEQTRANMVGVDTYASDALLELSKSGKVSPKVLAAVREYAAKNGAYRAAQTDLQNLDQRLTTNANEQNRLTSNMQRLPNNSDVYADYMNDLKNLTKDHRRLTLERGDLAAKVEALRKAADEYLQNLDVD